MSHLVITIYAKSVTPADIIISYIANSLHVKTTDPDKNPIEFNFHLLADIVPEAIATSFFLDKVRFNGYSVYPRYTAYVYTLLFA